MGQLSVEIYTPPGSLLSGNQHRCILVISCGDAAELLDPVEEALDEITLAVEPWREAEALLTV